MNRELRKIRLAEEGCWKITTYRAGRLEAEERLYDFTGSGETGEPEKNSEE